MEDNLHIKEVYVGQGIGRRRYVVAYNPQQAKLDQINRQQILERLNCELEVLNKKHKTKAQCNLLLHRSMGRYVKELKSGKLKIDNAKVQQEAKLDGKCLLNCSDESLSAEDIARNCWRLNAPSERLRARYAFVRFTTAKMIASDPMSLFAGWPCSWYALPKWKPA